MNWIFRLMPFFIAFVFLVILAQWALYGYVAVRGVQTVETNCTDGLAKCAGRVFKDFKDGMDGK